MSRTKLILIIFMLDIVGAHGQVLHEPQPRILTVSNDFTGSNPSTSGSVVLLSDELPAPASSRELNLNQSGVVATTQNFTSPFPATVATTAAAPNSGGNGNPQMWLIALASMAMVTWQVWRKQKSLRFGQSCLAKEADYAAH